ncbi:metal-sensitive transcriptional regulator [Streptomyces niger]|uniref:metal-sensitive transcriptional regulator n=1 Tax=Streptomyces niger TaxID=66373 RepID=UPI00069B0C78|nr:metal-sensitive transcriptional regulator [Streptomyces niger]
MPGYQEQRDGVLRHLRLIEGQVRGVQRMVEEDTYRIDILTQTSATRAALRSVALVMLDE